MTGMRYTQRVRGVTSIEVAFGVSIVAVILVFAMYAIADFINGARDVTEKTQALYLAEEGLELIRFARDEDWADISAIPLNTTRYIAASSIITATTTPEVIGEFTRSFTVQNVYRDNSTDDIVASTTGGSSADADSKYVTVAVSWGTPTSTVSLTSILADISP